MNIYKGGRGIKAPYYSKVVRVPEPLLDKVNALLTEFYNGSDSPLEDCYLYPSVALEQAKEILERNKTGKRSTKICLEKLLQVIYVDTTLKL